MSDAALSDEEWLRTVYRPNERQLTVRAVVFGCMLGSVMSAANLYTGFKIGWTYGVSITAAITSFALFKAWAAATRGPAFTVLENNITQTAASAAAALAGGVMVNAVPALIVLTGRRLSAWEILAYLASVSFLGMCFAVPLKRQMINQENLKFPSGIAAKEATLALYGEGSGGRERARALFTAAGAGGLLAFLRDGVPEVFKRHWPSFKLPDTWFIPGSLPIVGPTIGKYSFSQLTLQVDVNLLSLGAGALVGLRTTFWMAVGATICWAGFMPWVVDNQFVQVPISAPSFFGKGARWAVWPGVTMLATAGVLAFAFKVVPIVRALKRARSAARAGTVTASDVEVPTRWFIVAFGTAALACIIVQRVVFEMPIWQSVVAIALSFVLAMVGTRVAGETDVNPIGGMGKITQLLFAVLAQGNPQTNLMAAGVTCAGANNCGDLMQDMKTGRLLGASPRQQFLAQIFGIAVGSVATVLVFVHVFPIEVLGTAKYPAPAMQNWKNVAELLTKGLDALPKHAPMAILIAAIFATACTVLTEIGPAKLRRFIPSPTGLGLAFILPASPSYTFFVGALIATFVAKRWPREDALYTVAAASGVVAGEGILGILIAVYSKPGG